METCRTLGIDPIHFDVVCTVATVIGLVTPPVGPGLHIAMVQAEIRMGALFRATIPFLLEVLAVPVLIAAAQPWSPQYRGYAQFEEAAFLPLAQQILERISHHLAAMGLSLHTRHTPLPVKG